MGTETGQEITEEMVDDLWQEIERTVVDGIPILHSQAFKSIEVVGPKSRTALLAKETVRRTREALGFEGSLVRFSQPTIFIKNCQRIMLEKSEDVKRELQAGTLVVDGAPVQALSSDYDVEEDIKQGRETVEAEMSQSFRIEMAFKEAMANRDFDRAETLLRSITLIREGEDDPHAQVEVDNWEIDLAVNRGDIAGFLETFRKIHLVSSDERILSSTGLQNCLKVLLSTSMIQGIAVLAEIILWPDEQKQIDGLFWYTLLRKVAEGIMQTPELSSEEFQQLVKRATDETVTAVEMYPKDIKIMVGWCNVQKEEE